MSTDTSRRRFIQMSLAASSLASSGLRAQAAPADLVLSFGTPVGNPVPTDFIGLSYEAMQLEDAHFFSAKNTNLVNAFRKISSTGVLRLGGNTSEFSWWKESDHDAAPVRTSGVANDGEPSPNTIFAITPEAIRQLKTFLDATGWTCIYGLNLGYGTPETDVREAVFVSTTLGKHLEYFQIGNEVDLFWRHLRDRKTWNVDSYLADWLNIARAVQSALPEASFGMPDVASAVTWLAQIADRWAGLPEKVRVTTLSHHYYFGGPPSNPDVNLKRLLQPDPKVLRYANIAVPAADKMKVRLRMTEGNTCYQGGKPGVSDVLGSALWATYYSLTLMQLGYSGVNLHGGSGHAVAVSVGGLLRGEKLMTDPTAPHAKPFYTPIAFTEGSDPAQYRLQPVGVGLEFATNFLGTTMIPVSLHPASEKPVFRSSAEGSSDGQIPSSQDVFVFAGLKPNGKKLVAVINARPTESVVINMQRSRLIQVLTGSSLDSRTASLTENHEHAGMTGMRVPAHSAHLFEI